MMIRNIGYRFECALCRAAIDTPVPASSGAVVVECPLCDASYTVVATGPALIRLDGAPAEDAPPLARRRQGKEEGMMTYLIECAHGGMAIGGTLADAIRSLMSGCQPCGDAGWPMSPQGKPFAVAEDPDRATWKKGADGSHSCVADRMRREPWNHHSLVVDVEEGCVRSYFNGDLLITMPLPHPRWIPVSERLPETPTNDTGKIYFVRHLGGAASVAGYAWNRRPGWDSQAARLNLGWEDDPEYAIGPVTHWMPIPSLPEAGS